MKIPKQQIEKTSLKNRLPMPLLDNRNFLVYSFRKFNLNPVKINNIFNNHFKNQEHYLKTLTMLIGSILPAISKTTIGELVGPSRASDVLRFHQIENQQRGTVFTVLREYGYNETAIDQMSEGNNIYQFSGILGNTAARIVCEKIGDILFLLFIDANHHIYFNNAYKGNDSFFFEYCPINNQSFCFNMPNNCFAFDYLDEKKIQVTFDYNYHEDL